MENKMKANLPKIDQEKLDKIFEIEDLYESGKMSLEEARKLFAARWLHGLLATRPSRRPPHYALLP